jgi:hypothetical protein
MIHVVKKERRSSTSLERLLASNNRFCHSAQQARIDPNCRSAVRNAAIRVERPQTYPFSLVISYTACDIYAITREKKYVSPVF